MASIYLITPAEVFDAMGQNPDVMEDSTPAIQSAIIRATIKLEGLLKTSLKAETREDTFFVSGQDGAPLNNRYTLQLTNGVLNQNEAISTTVCDTVDGTYESVGNVAYHYDLGRAIVPINNTEKVYGQKFATTDGILGRYLKVSYSSGFSSASDTPDEIKQALLCFIPLLLLSSSAAAVDAKQASVAQSKASSLDSIGGDMVSRYMRRGGSQIKPMYTTLVT